MATKGQNVSRGENVMSNDRSDGKPQNRPSKNREGVKRRDLPLSASSLLAASALTTTGLRGSAKAELKEYKPGTTFPDRIGRTIGQSEPAWPAPIRAKSESACKCIATARHKSRTG
jgi:hypothetical protein